MKKVFIILGHPDSETLSGALASEYERGAREGGCEIRRTNLGDINFDPILHRGYKVIQELEPDLVTIQGNIKWADHIVVIYPNWWFTMPAILKGMFDRMFLPHFSFRIDKKTHKAQGLLIGKTARVIIVSGTYSPLQIRLKFGDYTNEVRRGVLGFSGIKPVRVTSFGPSDLLGDKKKAAWKRKIYRLGKKGK